MIKKISLLLIVVMGITSCENFVDVNTDPNNPTNVPPSLLLPTAQARLSFTLWGDFARYSSVFTQHIDGVSRQFAVFQNYGMTSSDVDASWVNLYSGVLADLFEIDIQANANGFNHYLGVSKVLQAYTLLLLTDYWDAIPWSDFKTDNLQPLYDSQADIMLTISSLLSDSRTLLSGVDNSGFTPGSDDLIFSGDTDRWIEYSYAIEARMMLRQDDYTAALTSIQSSFTSLGDVPNFQYGSSATTSSPWYQYIEQRDDIDGGANYISLLNSLNDPRDAYFGISDFTISHPYFLINQTMPYISWAEVKFIEAEATFETAGAAAAIPIYLDAIKASFDDLGLTTPDYNTYIAQASVNPAILTKSHIMTQKYIALYTDPETFSDWRRTGMPSLTPNTGTQIPRRFFYPQSELDLNTNTPSGVTQFDKVTWDN